MGREADAHAEVRDAILVHLRSLRGLGDPEEQHRPAVSPVAGMGPDVVEAARGVLAETRALRQALL